MPQAAPDWFEEEAFWATSYPFMFPPENFEEAREEIDALLALAGCEEGAVLDLACGPGRYAVPLAEHGFAVTGVDATPFLLDKGRAYARERSVAVEWVETDMRRFVRPAAFDLALSLFTSFGYFEAWEENEEVLRNVVESLKPGGVFVFDTLGKELIAQGFEATGSIERAEGLMIQRRRVIDDWSRMDNEWIMIQDGAARTFRYHHWIFSGRELKELLCAAGFAAVHLFGGLGGSTYGPEARRLVAVARKAAD